MWISRKSVSYTHLYVVLEAFLILAQVVQETQQVTDLATYPELGEIGYLLGLLHAVSYTHLDVYKRQILRMSSLR